MTSAKAEAEIAIATAGSHQERDACVRALAEYGKRIEAICGSKVKAASYVTADLLQYILNLTHLVAEEGRPDVAKVMLNDMIDALRTANKAGHMAATPSAPTTTD